MTTHLRHTCESNISQFTARDVPPNEEIYKGQGYWIYSAYSTDKARVVKIKLYEGSAKEVGMIFDNPTKHLLIYQFIALAARFMYE